MPLYNAIVYVPSAELEPFAEGTTCDKCGTTPSGKPIATALTDAKGDFVLNDVPGGAEFPLVVQIGRWRRKVMVPAVAQCSSSPVAAELTRLPRNKAEGEIPKMAITTGGADSLECFVRKLGIEAEMTNPKGGGRVHLYQGKRAGEDGSRIDSSTPTGNGSDGTRDVNVDTSFAKGQAFADWLGAVGATKAPGVVEMTDLKTSVSSVPGTGASPDTFCS